MSKFLYGSFLKTADAVNYLVEHINNNGGEASKNTSFSAMIDIVKWNNIENTTLTFFGDSSNVTLFVRDEVDNEAVFCFDTGKNDFTSNVYFVYYIHLSDGRIINEGNSSAYSGIYSFFPIIQSIFTKKEKFNISKMLSCRKIKNSTMISIADRDLYTADALIDTGVIYTDALGNKFIGAAPFILCKYDE